MLQVRESWQCWTRHDNSQDEIALSKEDNQFILGEIDAHKSCPYFMVLEEHSHEDEDAVNVSL